MFWLGFFFQQELNRENKVSSLQPCEYLYCYSRASTRRRAPASLGKPQSANSQLFTLGFNPSLLCSLLTKVERLKKHLNTSPSLAKMLGSNMVPQTLVPTTVSVSNFAQYTVVGTQHKNVQVSSYVLSHALIHTCTLLES